MTISEPEYANLQRTFAARSPVLAIGPGCHRVGYDTTDGWKEVHRRVTLVWHEIEALAGTPASARANIDIIGTQQFLGQLWVSKISDETLESASVKRVRALDDRAFGLPQDANYAPSDFSQWSEVDPIRTSLAALVLVAVRHATQLLGSVIAIGDSPVSSWREVSHVSPPEDDGDLPGEKADLERNGSVSDDDGEPSKDETEQEESDPRRSASEALGYAADLAEFAKRLAAGDTRNAAWGTAEALGLQGVKGGPGLKKASLLLKLGAVASSLRTLHDNHFEPGREVTGGMIEWLGDLFWHLVVVDSRVPPSMNELAFYLNLSDKAELPRGSFTRTIPGEGTGPLDREQIHGQVRSLLGAYDSGAEEWSDVSDTRLRLVRTLAATHLAAWTKAEKWRKARWNPKEKTAGSVPLPVMLVSDYDLSVERTIMEMLPEGQALHMVVPAWRDESKDPDLEWLWVTIRRQQDNKAVYKEDLITPDADAWRQFKALPGWLSQSDEQAVSGPILVKLHGSPLLNLSREAQDRLMNPDEGEGQRLLARPSLATIFTEYDALRALVSFTTAAGGLSTDIVEGLTWSTRSWVMLGERFPDWLPRVRLLLSARTRFRRDPKPQEDNSNNEQTHIAVDRAFDWPELALLSALDIDAYETDLSRVAAYPDQTTTASDDPDVIEFLGIVDRWLRRAPR